MDTVIIIPARGQSKRIPKKNLATLAGKPLLQHTLTLISHAGKRDIAFVSTDDAEIKYVAEQAGFFVIDRPAELATDTSSTEEVLMHALDELSKQDITPTWILTVEPTSPFRSTATLNAFFSERASVPEDIDCIFASVEESSYFWCLKDEGIASPLFPKAPRRGQLRKERGYTLHKEAGGLFLTRVSALRKNMEAGAIAPIFGSKAKSIPIDDIEAFDIDTQEELHIAEAIAYAQQHKA